MNNLTETKEADNILKPSDSQELEFLVGDVVVSLCDCSNPCLFEIKEDEHASYDEFVKCKPLGCKTGFVCFLAINEIRHATVTELNANRRLTDAELSVGEVS